MKRLHDDERGQSMVIIALAFVGLVAFLALVVDGGMVFAERRHMQNAADAAALAGAKDLLLEGSENEILAMVHTYAELNRVQDPAADVASKEKVIHRNLLQDVLLVSPQLIIILAFLAVLRAALGGATPFTLGNSFWCLFSAWVQLQVPMAASLPFEAEHSSGGRRCEAFAGDHTL